MAEVQNGCPPKLEEARKIVAKVVREVLLLHISCGCQKMSDIAFELVLETAFNQGKLPHEMRSQVHFARRADCRIDRDRVIFEREAPLIYGKTAKPEELDERKWPDGESEE